MRCKNRTASRQNPEAAVPVLGLVVGFTATVARSITASFLEFPHGGEEIMSSIGPMTDRLNSRGSRLWNSVNVEVFN